MKKINFSDRFGLTQAVLSGRKTMTRRICFMKKKIMIMQYKVSKDYKRLKQLLDEGNSVVCFVDFSHGGEYITDIAYAKRKGKGKYEHYNIYYNGRVHITIYTTWCSGFVDEKMYKMFESGNVQFIDPDYERNTLELEPK